MKKVILAIGWFTIVNFVLNFLGGFGAGFMNNFTKTFASGAEAGRNFNQQYGLIILAAALLIAIIGTVTGILPWTKEGGPSKAKKRKENEKV